MAKNNSDLIEARINKKDEFYTDYRDIEMEINHYIPVFRHRVIYTNTDNPHTSNFYKCFKDNFYRLQLKQLIATHYSSPISFKTVYDGKTERTFKLSSNGDFRSAECVDILKQADIIVTNPPFSLLREFLIQLLEYDKQFLIIGHQNALAYKEVFPYVRDNKVYLGFGFSNNVGFFHSSYKDVAVSETHKDGMIRVSGVVWITNLPIKKENGLLELKKQYIPQDYPVYDNYNAIEVSKTKDIPKNYGGVMGVPITFLNKYNPRQFELVGVTDRQSILKTKTYPPHIRVAKNGTKYYNTRDLEAGGALEIQAPIQGKTYYIVGDKYYTKTYTRYFIRNKLYGVDD